MKDSTIVLLGSLAFGLAGAAMLYAGLRARKLCAASLTWPTAPGRVVSSAIKAGAKGTVRFLVSYTYTVAGQTFTGGTANFGGVTSANEANRLIAAYPADSDATVHYNPGNPSQAALEAGGKGGLPLLIIGAMMLAFALGGLGLFAMLAAQGR
jgi:hypothetical protein